MPVSGSFLRHCRLLRIATRLVLAVLLPLLALGMIGPPWNTQMSAEQAGHAHFTLSLVRSLPGLGYLWALWAVQSALGDLVEGRLFHATVARAIRHIGIGVLLGALLNVFAVTNLSRWIVGGQGSYLYFDLSGIVLGVVGAALILLSTLIDQARGLQAELDEIL